MRNVSKFQNQLMSLTIIMLILASVVSSTTQSVLAKFEPFMENSNVDDEKRSSASSNSQTIQISTPEVFNLMDLNPVWTTGRLSDFYGVRDIIVTDLNQDGIMDIATCTPTNAYVMNYMEDGSYDTVWYSENIDCVNIAAGDRDGDGIQELYVVSYYGEVTVFSGSTFQMIGNFSYPDWDIGTDIKIANVDNDSGNEIIVLQTNNTLVYDAETFELEWQAEGMGGTQVEVGDIDGDAFPEIVINDHDTAYILNAGTKSMEWEHNINFGNGMYIGDIDNDQIDEIIYFFNNDLYVFEGDTRLIKWHRNNPFLIKDLVVSDVNEDNQTDIVIGTSSGDIAIVNGMTGETLWSIAGPLKNTGSVGVGDTNNDGFNEIVWGTGCAYSQKTGIVIGDWQTQSIEWVSDDLEGPFLVSSGDVDIDGQIEIIVVDTGRQNSMGGSIRVYDGLSHKMEWSVIFPTLLLYAVGPFAVGQLDNDAALEIVVGINIQNGYTLQVYDGITQSLEWTSPALGSEFSCDIQVMNIDSDSNDEILIGLWNGHLQIFDGASNVLQWDHLFGLNRIQDYSLGDLDGNGTLDLAVLASGKMFVYETGTWKEKLNMEMPSGEKLVIREKAYRNRELLVIVNSHTSDDLIQAFDGVSYEFLWQHSLGNVRIHGLNVNDFDMDGIQEIFLSGQEYINNSGYRPLFWIATPKYPYFWVYNEYIGQWGEVRSFNIADVDNDGQKELLFGSDNLFQLNEVNLTKVNITRTYLPIVSKPLPSKGIFGKVTHDGYPEYDEELELRYFDGTSWSTRATTMTASDGSYAFKEIPGLSDGQIYYVRYDTPNCSSCILFWATRSLEKYETASQVEIGNFDTAGVDLVSPISGEKVALPYTFQWIARPNTPSDSYQFNLFDPEDGNPDAYTEPLGYVNTFTMNSLPYGFNPNTYYGWMVWVNSPDGGYGVSFYGRWISFSNSGKSAYEENENIRDGMLRQIEEDIIKNRANRIEPYFK
ncbi:MAG: hypothetical protein CVU39_28320 [Chloroflexi bacterium HGW-Chloroflexi-10]|nr:MAG: hypothetical protein CVU39_28320 [Chloroflexi bacterium HGW-Chloroflexi-10]